MLNQCRDAYFEGCLFLSKADDTDKVFAYAGAATSIQRMLFMKDCTFFHNILGAGKPAHAVGLGAAQTRGSVMLKDCACVDTTVMVEAGVELFVAGAVPVAATTGVSVAS